MPVATLDFEQLLREHHALMRAHGRVQMRCSEQLREQALEIRRLDAQAMRLRAEVIVRDTALAWAREDRAALDRAIPGLPRRMAPAPRIEAVAGAEDASAGGDPADLEASLRAADLVICQTGCLSHGDYWRVQDHCRRTGKACVLVEQPEVLRIVRIHNGAAAPSSSATPE